MTDGVGIPSSWFGVSGSELGSILAGIMYAEDILPGHEPSYQICKDLFIFHPLGDRLASTPIRLAQSQQREIVIPGAPEEVLIEAFLEEWEKLDCTKTLLNLKAQSRIYGAASIGVLTNENDHPESELEIKELHKKQLAFNVWDPLNTSGSIVTDQNPNSPYFQKHGQLRVGGKEYHRSRTRTTFNGPSIYIAWTRSAFGFVGRSCYQRAFYPLKSFLLSMITDDMVVLKAGLLIAKMESPGTWVNRVMQGMIGQKRQLVKEGRTGQVLSIGTGEAIETLNMMNIDGAFGMARDNILKNIATAADDMPAKLLTQEAYVQGFGEGTQDAYAAANYIDGIREGFAEDYAFMDNIVQRRAWNPDFYETIQERFHDYGNVDYEEAFFRWRKAFKTTWPSLIREPPSEAAQVDEIKLKAVIAAIQVMLPEVDPESKAEILDWAAAQFNMRDVLFSGAKLVLDIKKISDYLVENEERQQDSIAQQQEQERAKPAPPFSGRDSASKIANIEDLVTRINKKAETIPDRRGR